MNKQERAFQHLHNIRNDIRDEIKQRIRQRDQYSNQLIISLGILLSFAASSKIDSISSDQLASNFHRVSLIAPLVSIYYTVLILYSYRVHKTLAKYLRKVIETKTPTLIEYEEFKWKKSDELENFYNKNSVPGIRKKFFLSSLWIISILSPIYVGFIENWTGSFITVVYVVSALYLLCNIAITKFFWRD